MIKKSFFLVKIFFRIPLVLVFIFLFLPFDVFAHEVYVLSTQKINEAMSMQSFNLFSVIVDNANQFVFWAFVGIVTICVVLWLSNLRFIEHLFEPIFSKIRKYSTLIARLAIGLSFLAGVYFGSIYGPEFPLLTNFGAYSNVISFTLVTIGVMIIAGLYVRLAAFIGLVIYMIMFLFHGAYMLTYLSYLGEIIVLLILGAHNFSLDKYFSMRGTEIKTKSQIAFLFNKVHNYLLPRSFAILRAFFGLALIYASVYAKILHNNLALFTVQQFHLDKLFGFEPHFLVLGAAIVEILIGLFFMFGFEIRFTAIFFLFWLCLSVWFFGEAVWPHLILLGIPIAYIFYGYDEYSLDGYFPHKKKYALKL